MPGLVLAVSLLIMNYICRKKYGYKGLAEGWSCASIGKAFTTGSGRSWRRWSFSAASTTGFFTPTESAIVAIFYTLVIGFFVIRN